MDGVGNWITVSAATCTISCNNHLVNAGRLFTAFAYQVVFIILEDLFFLYIMGYIMINLAKYEDIHSDI